MQTVETDTLEFIRGCLAQDLTPSLSLALWQQLGGRIRRQEWWRLWLAERERRDVWNAGAG